MRSHWNFNARTMRKRRALVFSWWHAIQDRWLIILYRGGSLEAIHAVNICVCVCVCVHVSRPKIKLRFRGITRLEFNFYPGLKQCYRSLEIRIDSRFRAAREFSLFTADRFHDIGENRFRIAREIRNTTRIRQCKFSTFRWFMAIRGSLSNVLWNIMDRNSSFVRRRLSK